MSLPDAVDPARLAALADELEPLVERLRATASAGREALRGEGPAPLARVVHRREHLLARIGPPMERLRVGWRVARENHLGTPVEMAALGRRVERLARRLDEVRETDAALLEELETLHEEAAREIVRIHETRRRGAAYLAGTRPTGRSLDLRR